MPGDGRSTALPPLLGGILIGGGSRRMGSPKVLLEWAGTTFVERIATALQSVVPEIVLLGSGSGLPASVAHHLRVADRPGTQGPIAGLLAAFAARPGAAWLILSCDQPLVGAATLEWLIGERRPGRIAVLSRRTPDRIEPFPGIYEPGCRSVLSELAAPERRGSLQPLAGVAGVHLLAVPEPLAGELCGVNTPEELADLRGRSALQARPEAGDPLVKDDDRD